MLCSGTRGLSGTPMRSRLTNVAVDGSSWPMPIAPAGDTTEFCHPDSCHVTAITNAGASPFAADQSLNVGTSARRDGDAASRDGMPVVGAVTVGIWSFVPTTTWFGSPMWFAHTMAPIVVP